MSRRRHVNRGVYRSRAEVAALREDVLVLWAAGRQLREIERVVKVPAAYVTSLVFRARMAGDLRATRRHAESPAWGPGRVQSQHDRVVSLHADGLAVDEIAVRIGQTRKRVMECLSRHRRAAR